MPSTDSAAVGLLPLFKIRAEDEEFPADLDDADPLFLNDSAEMPHGEPCKFGCIRDIQEQPLWRMCFGQLHVSSLMRGGKAGWVPEGVKISYANFILQPG